MSTKRVLLIGPFPPPIGGDTVLTLNVSRSRYWGERGITIDSIDTSAGGRVRLPDERLTLRDALRGTRILIELVAKLPRCGAVLLWANSRFIVTEGVAIILMCRACRKPIFVKVFGAYLARRILRMPQPCKKLLLLVLAKAVVILPETETLAREFIEECGFPVRRVQVLSNFLPDASFGDASGPKRFSGRCVFFGQVKREKGVFDIIDAIGGRANVSCDFYGPLLERDREDFLGAISRHRNLSYRGVVQPGAVSKVAMAYDVLLLPTYHQGEGYPAVILEAYSVGVPVIATKWLSLPEIVEHGVQGLLVPVRSPEEIRKALETLGADERLYESMRRNARAYVQSFSERAILGEILVPRVAEVLK
ncbi:MAG: glycosyltransferase family 4 protein [Candidatus Krumholzibacteriaceae bacterium]|jgi:glycosyltransferase involved in cell wall biosynthesis